MQFSAVLCRVLPLLHTDLPHFRRPSRRLLENTKEPVAGRVVCRRLLAEPVAGRVMCRRLLAEPVAGRVVCRRLRAEPVAGRVAERVNEQVAGRVLCRWMPL